MFVRTQMMSRFDASDDPEFNPYAAPETDSKEPIRHYRVVFWRLTYVECWRIAPNPLSFVLLALFKTLRVPVATVSAVTYPARLDLVDIHEVPPYMLDRWRPARCLPGPGPEERSLLPEIVTQAVTGRSLPEMVAAHRDWLAANALTVIPVPEASLKRMILARLQATFDRNVQRGLYVPISERDYEKLAQQSSRGLRPPSRAWQVLSKIEFSLLLVLVAVGIYLLVSGGRLIGGPKLFGADVSIVFFGLFVLVLLVGAIRSLVARSRA